MAKDISSAQAQLLINQNEAAVDDYPDATALTATTTLAGTDLFIVLTDVAGTKTRKKITYTALLARLQADLNFT